MKSIDVTQSILPVETALAEDQRLSFWDYYRGICLQPGRMFSRLLSDSHRLRYGTLAV
jgi:hypothetical protein